MKTIYLFILCVFIIFPLQANAELIVRGTDSLGNRLIYDTALNVTWYDYTHSYDYMFNQRYWATTLSVNFGGSIYDDWRLPTTVDGPFLYGYDGTTTAGYNITSSEMGHLFYEELGNNGSYDTSGNSTGCGEFNQPSCLISTGNFQNLQSYFYWSGTQHDSYYAWYFSLAGGLQSAAYQDNYAYGIAVRNGNVTVVPEPVSSILFLIGTGILAIRSFFKLKPA